MTGGDRSADDGPWRFAAGVTPKYAIVEHERRFLVDPAALPALAPASARLIEDLYLQDSRLRLRKMASLDRGETEYKLCKKYHGSDPYSGPIVNIYLTAAEYALLAGLPGRWLRKRRLRLADATSSFHIDLFEGALAGLVIAEVERADREALGAITAPAWAVREITTDPYFTGGQLVSVDAADLGARLRHELSGLSAGEEDKTP